MPAAGCSQSSNNLTKEVPSWGNRGTDRLRDAPRLTHWAGADLRFRPRVLLVAFLPGNFPEALGAGSADPAAQPPVPLRPLSGREIAGDRASLRRAGTSRGIPMQPRNGFHLAHPTPSLRDTKQGPPCASRLSLLSSIYNTRVSTAALDPHEQVCVGQRTWGTTHSPG